MKAVQMTLSFVTGSDTRLCLALASGRLPQAKWRAWRDASTDICKASPYLSKCVWLDKRTLIMTARAPWTRGQVDNMLRRFYKAWRSLDIDFEIGDRATSYAPPAPPQPLVSRMKRVPSLAGRLTKTQIQALPLEALKARADKVGADVAAKEALWKLEALVASGDVGLLAMYAAIEGSEKAWRK